MSIKNCYEISLPLINDYRGNLVYIEGSNHIPFDIKRVYYIYDIPLNFHRGEHAHRKLHQFILAISGSFDLTINDGVNSNKIHLNTSSRGMYLCPMIWRSLTNFSPSAICLVFASELYSEDDYIRQYQQFILEANAN